MSGLVRRTITAGLCAAALTAPLVPLAGAPADAAVRKRVNSIKTITYAPNSFIIGNAYPAWSMDVQGPAQFSRGPGNPNGAFYRWGYLYGGTFNYCAWVADGGMTTIRTDQANRCRGPQQIDEAYFRRTFTNGQRNAKAGDGSATHMDYSRQGCTMRRAYGNVNPWRNPTQRANALPAEVPNRKSLLWRYVTKDSRFALVRDPAPTAGQPNWYFVARACIALTELAR